MLQFGVVYPVGGARRVKKCREKKSKGKQIGFHKDLSPGFWCTANADGIKGFEDIVWRDLSGYL